MVKKWVCMVCGDVHEGESPPDRCQKCGAPQENFIKKTSDNEEFE